MYSVPARIAPAFLLFASSVLSPTTATACFRVPSPSEPCEDNMNTEAVFVARVEGVRRVSPASGRGESSRKVHVVVIEAFRGVADPELDLFSPASDCGIDFQNGKEYLIYAWRDSASHQLQTYACSRTALAERSEQNIEELRSLLSGRGTARVFGFVTADPANLEIPFRASSPVEGIPIVLRSSGHSWRTITDFHGDYEFKDLPPATYEEAAELQGNGADRTRSQITLTAGACSRQNFLSVPVARISGRLLDSGNQPVSGVLVEIEAVPPTRQPRPIFRKFTDADGRFTYTNLEMGRYVLGVNLENPPYAHDWYDKRSRLPRAYYAGVTDRDQAAVVTLQGGQNVDELEFRLPPSPHVLTLRGNVVLPDRSPVQAYVSLIDLEYPGTRLRSTPCAPTLMVVSRYAVSRAGATPFLRRSSSTAGFATPM